MKRVFLTCCLLLTSCSRPTISPSNLKFQAGDRARIATDTTLGATRWEVQTDAIRFQPNGTQIRGVDRTGRTSKPNLVTLQAGTPVLILYRSRTQDELDGRRPYIAHYSLLEEAGGTPDQHVEVDSTACVRVLDGPHRDFVGFVLASQLEGVPAAKLELQDAKANEYDLKVGDILTLSGRFSLFFTFLKSPVEDLGSIRRRHVIVRPDPAQEELSEGSELVAIFEMADGSILHLGEIVTEIRPDEVRDNPYRVVESNGGVYRIKNEGNPIELFNLYLFEFKEPVGTIAGPHVVRPKMTKAADSLR